MTAGIVKGSDITVVTSYDDDGGAGHINREKVARLGYAAGVPNINPDLAEDSLNFEPIPILRRVAPIG